MDNGNGGALRLYGHRLPLSFRLLPHHCNIVPNGGGVLPLPATSVGVETRWQMGCMSLSVCPWSVPENNFMFSPTHTYAAQHIHTHPLAIIRTPTHSYAVAPFTTAAAASHKLKHLRSYIKEMLYNKIPHLKALKMAE